LELLRLFGQYFKTGQQIKIGIKGLIKFARLFVESPEVELEVNNLKYVA